MPGLIFELVATLSGVAFGLIGMRRALRREIRRFARLEVSRRQIRIASRIQDHYQRRFQSSLRDSFRWWHGVPRTASWAKFSRPCGTRLASVSSNALFVIPGR